MIESKYLEFDKIGDTGLTEIWNVLSKSTTGVPNHMVDFALGKIRWYGAWRQYCFWPSPNCVFNRECMTDIQNMIQELMDDRAKVKLALKKIKDKRAENEKA